MFTKSVVISTASGIIAVAWVPEKRKYPVKINQSLFTNKSKLDEATH